MKNLKKTLSLVLVAVMMLGILTIGAGAAFTDQDDVDYTEAVEVLSAIKVLEGFEDGSFKPDQILTREQAAKIIAYAMLGKTAADALTTGTAPFNDVPATRWSAGYITFCVNQGIINGYGDGRFGPADTLTGFQFAKMLLTALGYGKNDEFVGSNWTIEVAKLAIPLGIFDGNTDGASNAPCTREAAALYAFNAMTKCMTVNYAEALGIYYSGTNALQAPAPLDEHKHTLGYKVFNLESNNADVGGRNGHYWVVNGVKVSDFYSSDKILGTYTSGLDFVNMTFDALTVKGPNNFFFIAESEGYKVFYNGTELIPVEDMSGTVSVSADEKYFDVNARVIRINDNGDLLANTGDSVYALPKGTTVQLISTKAPENKVDVINVIEKSVIKILADPIVSFGSVKINGLSINTQYVTGYEDLKKGDYALTVTIDGITHYEKCDTVTGVLEATGTSFGSRYYTIAGNMYSLSGLAGNTATVPTNYDYELTFYLDDNGYIVASTTDTVTTSTYYGVVLAAEGGQFNPITGTGAYAKVHLLTQTGETQSFDIVSGGRPDIATANLLADGELVSYKLTTANKISEIKAASDLGTGASIYGPVDYEKGDNQINDLYLNSSTYFFYYYDEDPTDSIPAVYSVIKGYTNAPSAAGVSGYTFASGNIAKAVLMDTEAAGSVDVVFISSMDYTVERLDDGTLYFVYPCFRNGAQETINVDNDLGLSLFDPSGAFSVVKDPVTGIYTATRLRPTGFDITDYTTYAPVTLANADSSYFICPRTTATYDITTSTKVYLVTYGVNDAIVDVQPSSLVAPDISNDVKIVAVSATGSGTSYTANAVFYRIDPKA